MLCDVCIFKVFSNTIYILTSVYVNNYVFSTT